MGANAALYGVEELGIDGFGYNATSFYNASGSAVINVGLKAAKDFKLSDTCGLALFVKGICNPRDDKGYILAGISFATF